MIFSKYGFTLTELLVVISIMVVLAAMLLPVIGTVRDMAISTKCMSNLGQQNLAFRAYANDWRGFLPYPMADPTWSTEMIPGWNVNLSINYGSGKGKTQVTPADTNVTLGDGVFIEPRYKRVRPITTHRWDTGYGMNIYLPPSILTTTARDKAEKTSPRLARIAQPALTPLVADTTNCKWDPNTPKIGCSWSLELCTGWYIENLFGYIHRAKANVLYVDGHVELQSYTKAYTTFTTTMAYRDLLTPGANATW
jgi:prepilin-type N-terminal cleavage/methylation domain-containing protein/prepilin-type processing-associated H-X9-DG protein